MSIYINRFPFGILATLLVLTAVVSALAIFAGSDDSSADTLPQPFITRLVGGTQFSDVTCDPHGFEMDADIQVGTVPNATGPGPGARGNCPGDDWSTLLGTASGTGPAGSGDAVFFDGGMVANDIRACGANGNNPNDAVSDFTIERTPGFPTSAFGCDDIALGSFKDCTTHTQGDKVDDGTYHIVEGGAQPKADIENFYSAIKGTTAFVGFERVANSGDTHLNVAFKQSGAIINPAECLGSDPGRSSGWTVNDLIANVNYSGGTLLPSVSVFRVQALGPADSDGNLPAILCQVTPGPLEVANSCIDAGIQVFALTNCTLFQPHSQVRCDEDNSNIEAGYWLATISDGTQDNPSGNSAGRRNTSTLVQPTAPGNNGQPESQRPPRSFIEVSITSALINPCFANLQVQSRASGESVTSALSDIGEASFPGCKIFIEKRDEATNQLVGGTTFSITPNPFACLPINPFPGDPLFVTDNEPPDIDPTDGVIELSPVCPGAYTVTEEVAPDGWSINLTPDTSCEILVGAGSNECTVIILDPLGSLHIEKDDELGRPVPGAEFLVEPNPYWCTSGSRGGDPSPGAAHTGSLVVIDGGLNDELENEDQGADDGMMWLFDVCIEDYTVTETSAPDGYSLDPVTDQERSCIVSEATSQTCTVTFVDPLGSLHIEKDDELGRPVPGAEFLVEPNPYWCTSGSRGGDPSPGAAHTGSLVVIDGGLNDELENEDQGADDGMMWLFDVCIEDYLVTETKAPEGFIALTAPQPCIVSEPLQTCSVTFVNQGQQACTPGFWQGPNEGRLRWDENGLIDTAIADPQWGGTNPNPFNTGDLFYEYFSFEGATEATSVLFGLTMEDLIKAGPVGNVSGGNIVRQSARFAIAAALNAEWGMAFAFPSGAAVQAKWDEAALDGITFQQLFNDLSAAFADKDCPIPELPQLN